MLPMNLPEDHPLKEPDAEGPQFFPVCYRRVPEGDEDLYLPYLAFERPTIAELKDELLLEALEDWRGLWTVIWPLREELRIEDPKERRAITMSMISDLLWAGFMQPGFPTRDGKFEPWQLSTEETLDRIEREWDEIALARRERGRNEWECEPGIGDIVWFDLTPEGEDHARGLELRMAEDQWGRLPEVEAEIDEWPRAKQVYLVEEWTLEERRLKRLRSYAEKGAMTEEQLGRYENLKKLVAKYRPIIDRLAGG